MGLFDKKICCLCGKKAGFLSTKLVDGSYLCSKCDIEYLIYPKLADVYYYPSFKMEELDAEGVELYANWHKQNQANLRDFTCTKSVGDYMHFDMNKCMVVFADKIYLSRRKKIEGINPPVFFLTDLCMYYTTLIDTESYAGLTSANVVESKVGMLVGTKDPVYGLVCVPVGTVKTKEGLFKSKTKISPDVEVALNEMSIIMQACMEYFHDHPDTYVACLDFKLHKQLLYRAKDVGLFTADELNEHLRELDT